MAWQDLGRALLGRSDTTEGWKKWENWVERWKLLVKLPLLSHC